MTIDEEMDHLLRDSAVTVDQAPDAETGRRYAQFMAACQARTEREVLNQQADMDGYADGRDKDLADYERAERAFASGELHVAAEWYRKAAENDFANSALKLAKVLEHIAKQHAAMPGRRASSSELFRVIEDSSHWYITAYMVGDIDHEEVVKRLDQLMNYIGPAAETTRPMLTVAVRTDPGGDEHETSEPGPRSESLSLATPPGDELRSQQETHLDPASDHPSIR